MSLCLAVSLQNRMSLYLFNIFTIIQSLIETLILLFTTRGSQFTCTVNKNTNANVMLVGKSLQQNKKSHTLAYNFGTIEFKHRIVSVVSVQNHFTRFV